MISKYNFLLSVTTPCERYFWEKQTLMVVREGSLHDTGEMVLFVEEDYFKKPTILNGFIVISI